MRLPEYVTHCLNALEEAGYAAYAVGGCVRDLYLGREPHDYDLCTAALPEQTETVFRNYRLVLSGKKHGTVGVVMPEGVVEITTFRTEGNYSDNRHPDRVEFVPEIENDLARRDFTVNAMAWSPKRGFADPFGGRDDLNAGILRAVGNPEKRFQEDSLRILRGVRFAVRYGLKVEPETEKAMFRLVPLMENLARERVFDELCALLPTVKALDLQRFAPVICGVIPELAPTLHFDQRSPHHAYDLYTHISKVVEQTPPDLILRWAALLHDTGKIATFTTDATGRGHFYGHDKAGAEIADGILRRLKASTALREQVVLLISRHMMRLEPNRKTLRRWLSKLGRHTVDQLLWLQQADMGSKGEADSADDAYFQQIRDVLVELEQEDACLTLKDLAVKGNDLMALGITGRAIGQTLNCLLEKVLEEELPNDKNTLLQFVKDAEK